MRGQGNGSQDRTLPYMLLLLIYSVTADKSFYCLLLSPTALYPLSICYLRYELSLSVCSIKETAVIGTKDARHF